MSANWIIASLFAIESNPLYIDLRQTQTTTKDFTQFDKAISFTSQSQINNPCGHTDWTLGHNWVCLSVLVPETTAVLCLSLGMWPSAVACSWLITTILGSFMIWVASIFVSLLLATLWLAIVILCLEDSILFLAISDSISCLAIELKYYACQQQEDQYAWQNSEMGLQHYQQQHRGVSEYLIYQFVSGYPFCSCDGPY